MVHQAHCARLRPQLPGTGAGFTLPTLCIMYSPRLLTSSFGRGSLIAIIVYTVEAALPATPPAVSSGESALRTLGFDLLEKRETRNRNEREREILIFSNFCYFFFGAESGEIFDPRF